MAAYSDDIGQPVEFAGNPARIVSLVPSLTEAIAVSVPGALVGATDWCTHPADLEVTRIGGTKNPDVATIEELRPDLVVANAEENREVDLNLLREAGLNVWVTDIRDVGAAIISIGRLFDAIGISEAGWLAEARDVWRNPPQVVDGKRLRAVIPIWRKPWMHVGSNTYAGDLLARLGIDNVLAEHEDRYPTIPIDELPAVDLIVLPDEPYQFTTQDGPGFFPGTPCALVNGRLLTWYGPAMVTAATELVEQLRSCR